MSNGLKVAPPPKRPVTETPAPESKTRRVPTKFKHIAEIDTVQFNKRITRGTADGYEMLAIKLRRKVPDLLAEALELLENKYGRV